MNTRKEIFLSFKDHPFFCKTYKQLKPQEIQDCLDWIADHDGYDVNDFAHHANRMSLDQPMTPKEQKRFALKWELITSANSKLGALLSSSESSRPAFRRT